MKVTVLWGIRDFAQAVVDLPVAGALPTRTVLVPNARVAHALRRELLRTGQAAVLAGTRFVGLTRAAGEVLQAVGVEFTHGEGELRAVRVRTVLWARPKLKALDLDLLLEQPGWDEAIATAIDALEEAGLRPGELPASGVLGDVRVVWEKVEAAAGKSWSTARILREAAAVLQAKPRSCPFEGAVLASATGHEPAVQARFVGALPEVVLGLVAARPLRERHVERVAALYGKDARDALAGARAPEPAAKATERDLLAAYFFEEPAQLADPKRPRSHGRDGTVDLEEHAGVEDEIEAAVDWVGREALAGTPLEEIAVLLPSLHPLATMVATRLQRLQGPDGEPLPVYVAGGLPLEGTAAGARALAVVRALRAHLPADLVARLLPFMRMPEGEPHLSASTATELVYSLGTLGGNPAAPAGALAWSGRAAARAQQLAAIVAEAAAVADEPMRAALQRQGRDAATDLARLQKVQPALEALNAVAAVVHEGRSLPEVWAVVRAFLADHVPSPGAGTPIQGVLDAALREFCDDAGSSGLAGHQALALIEEVITSWRVAAGRFGEPAVYVGSVAGAAGLPFTAVRVLGLSEGQLPSNPREDPVLPEADELQKLLPGALVPAASDRVLRQLHALDRVICGATARVVLSAPRRGLEGSDREPSSLFIEAAAAVARPPAPGKLADAVPDTEALHRDYFRPARRAAAEVQRDKPLTQVTWQARAADPPPGGEALPASWKGPPEVDLKRIRELRAEAPGETQGILGDDGALLVPPGLTDERPISASALSRLFKCPHLFLLERILGWESPAAASPTTMIEPLSYGTLFHTIAERFAREHGADFNARKRNKAAWQKAARQIAGEELDRFLEHYPLAGDAVKQQQRDLLLRQVDDFIGYEWEGLDPKKPRTLVGAEVPFGFATPLPIKVGRGRLFVNGFMDRLDKEGGTTLVRDLKTGASHPRRGKEAEATPDRDLQLGLYGLVVKELAAALRTPSRVAVAYTYVDGSERAFRDDFDDLAVKVQAWLGVAYALLKERAFPRNPLPEACEYCDFAVVCSVGAAERSAAVDGCDGAVGKYRDLVAPPPAPATAAEEVGE